MPAVRTQREDFHTAARGHGVCNGVGGRGRKENSARPHKRRKSCPAHRGEDAHRKRGAGS